MSHPRKCIPSMGAVALSALLLVGCGAGGSPGASPTTAGPGDTASAVPTATDTPTPSALPSGTATLSPSTPARPTASDGGQGAAEATLVAGVVAAAEEAVSGSRAFAIDRKDGRRGWEVKVAVGDREREVDVSADGSQVTPQQRDDALDRDDRERLAQAQVPIQNAVRTALGEVDGMLDEAELDAEDGVIVWEIDIDGPDGSSVDVYVNVKDGSVLKVDR